MKVCKTILSLALGIFIAISINSCRKRSTDNNRDLIPKDSNTQTSQNQTNTNTSKVPVVSKINNKIPTEISNSRINTENNKNNLLLLAGGFDTFNNQNVNNLALYNLNKDIIQYYDTLKIQGGGINSIAINDSKSMYIGGTFTEPYRYIFALYPNSIKNIAGNINGPINALHLVNDKLYVGGAFTSIGTIAANNIAMYDTLKGTWHPLGKGSNQLVTAITDYQGVIYAGIASKTFDNKYKYYLAKWDGSSLQNIGQPLNKKINTILIKSWNEIYVGGYFTQTYTADDLLVSTTLNGIAKFNGSKYEGLGDILAKGVGPSGTVNKIISNSNIIYIGGFFKKAHTIEVNNIASWDGKKWSALGEGVNGEVYDMCFLGTDLYVVGSFKTASGIEVNNIAKWDGQNWHNVGSGTNGVISTIKVVSMND